MATSSSSAKEEWSVSIKRGRCKVSRTNTNNTYVFPTASLGTIFLQDGEGKINRTQSSIKNLLQVTYVFLSQANCPNNLVKSRFYYAPSVLVLLKLVNVNLFISYFGDLYIDKSKYITYYKFTSLQYVNTLLMRHFSIILWFFIKNVFS